MSQRGEPDLEKAIVGVGLTRQPAAAAPPADEVQHSVDPHSLGVQPRGERGDGCLVAQVAHGGLSAERPERREPRVVAADRDHVGAPSGQHPRGGRAARARRPRDHHGAARDPARAWRDAAARAAGATHARLDGVAHARRAGLRLRHPAR